MRSFVFCLKQISPAREKVGRKAEPDDALNKRHSLSHGGRGWEAEGGTWQLSKAFFSLSALSVISSCWQRPGRVSFCRVHFFC